MIRQCHLCGAQIFLCNGAVHAGDLLDAMDGKISYWKVREKCGRCVFKLIMKSMKVDIVEEMKS
jgi:hypothetical protein